MRALADRTLVDPDVLIETANAMNATADLVDLVKEGTLAQMAGEQEKYTEKALEAIGRCRTICEGAPPIARHILFSLLNMVAHHEITWEVLEREG